MTAMRGRCDFEIVEGSVGGGGKGGEGVVGGGLEVNGLICSALSLRETALGWAESAESARAARWISSVGVGSREVAGAGDDVVGGTGGGEDAVGGGPGVVEGDPAGDDAS